MTAPVASDPRIDQVLEFILALARGDLERTLEPTGRDDELDGIFVGLSMLAEELAAARALAVEREQQALGAARLAAIGELAGSVAHQMNNPLSVITLHAELLRQEVGDLDETSPAELRARVRAWPEYVDALVAAARQCHVVVTRLLSFSRTPRPQPVEMDLREPVDRAIDLCKHRLALQGAHFERHLPDLLPVLGDVDLLAQIFLNLLLNAADATARGDTVRVSGGQGDGQVWVEVRDNGRGIEPEIRGRIFEPFFTTKTATHGTGLGLALSAAIAAQHGGRLEVASSPGEGARFTLLLPGLTP